MLDKFFKTIEKIVPVKYRWILNHDGFKRYFTNTGWMFIGQMFSLLVAFFVGAYIARYLGPKNFGLMSYSISFVGLFGFLNGFGIDSILNRELVKYPEKKNELLGTSFLIKIIGSISAILMINIISFFGNYDFLTRLLILIFSFTFIFQSFSIISIYFQSQVTSKKSVTAQIISTLISAVVKLIFIYLNFGVIWIVALYVFDSMSLAILLLISFYKNDKRLFRVKVNFVLLRKLLTDSIPLMFTIVTITIYSKIDQVILKHLLNGSAVGVYAVAVKMSEIWYFIPAIICASLFPAIINAKKTELFNYRKRLKNLYLLLIFISLFVSISIFLSSSFLIKFLFGLEYESSIAILKIYIWSIIPIFYMTAVGQYLLTENYTKIYFITTFIGATTNVILNFILIPKFGVEGSAVATLISYSLVPLSLIFFKKTKEQLILVFKKYDKIYDY